MPGYILRRLLLMIPTLFGILLVNFLVIQAAPGGPVERTIAAFQGRGGSDMERLGGGGSETLSSDPQKRGTNITPELLAEIKALYGFDKPPVERFLLMVGNYLTFDFGKSFFRDQRVVDLVAEKLPVSLSLGLWTLLLTYGVSIPLGIAKAMRDGSRFDVVTSVAVIIGYAVPAFLFAVLLIVLFAGGSFLSIFPLRGLTSDDWDTLSLGGKILDYFWHLALPLTAMLIGGFASLTLLTKNSFIDEIGKAYVLTARAKGLSDRGVLYGHIFRNAMLLVIAGFPAAFIATLFTSSLLIEVIFSLDGLGLLGFEATTSRDYPIMFGTLYVFTLIGLLLQLLGDIVFTWVDPRIDFNRREG